MGGKILESYTEKTERRTRREMTNAVKDIAGGMKMSELKKKYSAETIKSAKETIKAAKSIA